MQHRSTRNALPWYHGNYPLGNRIIHRRLVFAQRHQSVILVAVTRWPNRRGCILDFRVTDRLVRSPRTRFPHQAVMSESGADGEI